MKLKLLSHRIYFENEQWVSAKSINEKKKINSCQENLWKKQPLGI